MKNCLIAQIGILAAACYFPAKAQNYTFQNIPTCNSLTAFPIAMNGSGAVVGSARGLDSRFNSGMLYANGKCQTFPVEDFSGITDAYGIFGTDNSVTNYYVPPGGKKQALPNVPSGEATEYCCMDILTGVMAGNYTPAGDPVPLSGFFYQNGTFSLLPWNLENGSNGPTYWYQIFGLNGRGVAVGMYETVPDTYGFVFENGKMTFHSYPEAVYTLFMAVNDNNIAVGTYFIAVGTYFIRNPGETGFFTYDIDAGTWTKLNFPAEYVSSQPVGISNAGVILLQYAPTGGMALATPTGN